MVAPVGGKKGSKAPEPVEFPSGLLERHSPGRKIDPQSIIGQQARANQDCAAVGKRRLRSHHPTVEREIDKEDVFLDSLISRQK